MTPPRHLRQASIVVAILSVATLSALAKDSRNLTFFYPCRIKGTEVAAGEYTLKWVSHSAEATATLTRGKDLVVTFQGKWVDRDVRYARNMIVYEVGPDGSWTPIEIRLGGTRKALLVVATETKSQGDVLTPVRGEPTAGATRPGEPQGAPKPSRVRFVGKPTPPKRILDSPSLDPFWPEEFPHTRRRGVIQSK